MHEYLRGNLNALDEISTFLDELEASHGKRTVAAEIIELLRERLDKDICYYESAIRLKGYPT